MSPDILFTHKDLAFHAEEGGDRGRGYPMLTGSSLRNHSLFAHPPGEERLPQGVVDLVRACMAEVFPFEVDLCPAQFIGETSGVIEGGLPSGVFPEIAIELLLKGLVLFCLKICLFQFNEGGHQCLGCVASSKDTEMSAFIRPLLSHRFTLS